MDVCHQSLGFKGQGFDEGTIGLQLVYENNQKQYTIENEVHSIYNVEKRITNHQARVYGGGSQGTQQI